MRRSIFAMAFALGGLAFACSGSSSEAGPAEGNAPADSGTPQDASASDSALLPPNDADSPDASSEGGCEWGGAPGECISTSDCASLVDHTSYAGKCPGPVNIQCCITTPNPADNPPTPAGYKLMQQSDVTPEMTTWAVVILDDPVTYPMFSTSTKTFGVLTVLARVEWHPPDFQNSAVHRGVTLYEPS